MKIEFDLAAAHALALQQYLYQLERYSFLKGKETWYRMWEYNLTFTSEGLLVKYFDVSWLLPIIKDQLDLVENHYELFAGFKAGGPEFGKVFKYLNEHASKKEIIYQLEIYGYGLPLRSKQEAEALIPTIEGYREVWIQEQGPDYGRLVARV